MIINIDDRGYWNPRSFPTESLTNVLNIFDNSQKKIIVEIGSGLKGIMNGNSALMWTKSKHANKIFCVDKDINAINDIKNNISDKRLHLIQGRGEDFLREYKYEPIDLLYLDFWETRITKDNYLNLGEKRAKAHLEIYELISKKMSSESMILIDDTDHIPPWKHTYIIPRAIQDGFRVKWSGRQTLLTRGDL